MGRIFSAERINLFHEGNDTALFALLSYLGFFRSCELCNLEIRKAHLLGFEKKLGCTLFVRYTPQKLLHFNNVLNFIKEPLIDARKFINSLKRIVSFNRFRDGKDPAGSRLAELLLEIGETEVIVANQAMHPCLEHPESLLQCLLECAADGHHLAHRFHRRPNSFMNAPKLLEIPAGNFDDHVIESRLEAGLGDLGNRVLQLGEAIPQCQLGGDIGQGIASRL